MTIAFNANLKPKPYTLPRPLSPAPLLDRTYPNSSHGVRESFTHTRTRTPLKEMKIVGGIVFGVAFKFALKAIVMPLFGADPVNHAYHYLAGNRAAIPFALFALTVGAGFGEETVFRGFLFERLGKLFGSSIAAKTAIVAITSIWFGLAHYSVQGLAGTEQAIITGLTFGAIVAITGRIWMVMIAHAAFDLTAYAMIYWNVETPVAHFLFR